MSNQKNEKRDKRKDYHDVIQATQVELTDMSHEINTINHRIVEMADVYHEKLDTITDMYDAAINFLKIADRSIEYAQAILNSARNRKLGQVNIEGKAWD